MIMIMHPKMKSSFWRGLFEDPKDARERKEGLAL